MHAVVVRVSIEDAESGESELHERVVPTVSQLPGFVSGYWSRSDDKTNGLAFVLFESEENARGMEERLSQDGPPTAVSVESVEVREVIANA